MHVRRAVAKDRGFTLVEILGVIAIMGMLAAISTFALQEIQKKWRDERRKSDLSQIQLALRMHKDATTKYPEYRGGATIGEGGPLDGVLLAYFPVVPRDPLAERGEEYGYYYDSEVMCANMPGKYVTMLFALTMEYPSSPNYEVVCEIPGGAGNANGPGTGVGAGYGNDDVDESAYAIILYEYPKDGG